MTVTEQLLAIDLYPHEKADLLLVYLGHKPGTIWYDTVVRRYAGRPDQLHDRARFDQVVAWAKQAGLANETVAATVNPHAWVLRGIEGRWLRDELAAKGTLQETAGLAANPAYADDRLTLYVARDSTWLDRLKAADETNDPALYGQCVGFPDTAIDAYMHHRAISPRSVHGRIAPATLAFAGYGVSPEHAADELKTAAAWAKAVRRAAPTLYEQILNL